MEQSFPEWQAGKEWLLYPATIPLRLGRCFYSALSLIGFVYRISVQIADEGKESAAITARHSSRD